MVAHSLAMERPVDRELDEFFGDVLHDAGAGCDLLAAWRSLEEAMLKGMLGATARRLPPRARQAALLFLAQLCGFGSRLWFQAAAVLDAGTDLLWTSGLADMAELPATCLAAWRLVLKGDNAGERCWISVGGDVSAVVEPLVDNLVSLGLPVPGEVTRDDIDVQERALLHAVRWGANVPSLRCWLEILLGRLRIVHAALDPAVFRHLEEHGLSSARALVLLGAPDSERCPRRFAIGILVLGLVRMGIVNLEAVRPAHVDEEEWEELYLESQFQASLPDPAQLPLEEEERMLRVVRFVMGCDQSELVLSCELAASCLRVAHDVGGGVPPTSP